MRPIARPLLRLAAETVRLPRRLRAPQLPFQLPSQGIPGPVPLRGQKVRSLAATAWHRDFSSSRDRPPNSTRTPADDSSSIDADRAPKSDAQSEAQNEPYQPGVGVGAGNGEPGVGPDVAAAERGDGFPSDTLPPPPTTTEEQQQQQQGMTATARFSSFMDRLQARYVAGLQTFNSLTGYAAIETLTSRNARLERSLAESRAATKGARRAYQDATSRQVAAQRDMATLLARKGSWTPSDKGSFAALLEDDYRLEREVAETTAGVEQAEQAEQALIGKWVAGMARQYYEHQVYSDRIRRASTWGTWGLMGLNVLLFVLIQFVAEPWRRGRLLAGVEDRERMLLDSVEERLRQGFADVRGDMAAGTKEAAERWSAVPVPSADDAAAPVRARETAPRTWAEVLTEPRLWGHAFFGLYDRLRSEMRTNDVISMSLQGVLILLLLRN